MKKFTSERASLISFILNFLGKLHQPEMNISSYHVFPSKNGVKVNFCYFVINLLLE